MARPRSEKARAKMLATTTELVLDLGVPAFSIEEVARRSGVAKTTIYRHFTSGNELLVAALDSIIAPFPAPDEGSLEADLLAFLDATLPIFVQPELRAVMLDVLAASARDEELRAIHMAMVRERMRPMEAIFARAQARGEISPDVSFDEGFDFIEGPFMARWLMRPELLSEIEAERVISRIVRCLS